MVLVTIGAVFYFWADIESFYHQLLDNLVEKEIVLPGPLRGGGDSKNAFLTRSGVIQWTNTQRRLQGLPELIENPKLNSSAAVKAQDMLDRQYFDHVSPSGVSVSDLADQANYKYLSIGENLALGNFKNDEILVQAWMDSPGHRANILNTKYREIGVAVIRGEFEGRMVWLAVQHFGLPETVCPPVDQSLKVNIDARELELKNLRYRLAVLEEEINKMQPKRGEGYNRKVDEYNVLAKEYNRLLDEQKTWIAQYNTQVSQFNSCLQSYR